MIQRSFVSVVSDDLAATRDFFVGLFGYRVEFYSDWFVHLQAPDDEQLELGILRRDQDLVPEAQRGAPTGAIPTIVVDDVDELHRRAVELGVEVREAPRDLFYGQRRMLVVDPNGWLVDVSSECEPDPEWVATLGAG